MGIMIIAVTPENALAQDESILNLSYLASYETGIFDKSAAEIVVYNKKNKFFYVVNGAKPSIDIFQLEHNKTISLPSLNLSKKETPTSVAIFGNFMAATVHDATESARMGKIILFDSHHNRIAEFMAGSLPDMVIFSPDGQYILSANEGEPLDGVDPVGGITMVILDHKNPKNSVVKELTFDNFNTKELAKEGVRIAKGKTFSQDAEPEYIAFSHNSAKAWVSLQENNALAEISLQDAKITKIIPLGLKDHNIAGQGIDPNDKDGLNIINVPVMGMYMPDAITTLEYKGKTYILTANEGDARDEEVKANKANFDNSHLSKEQIKSLGKLRISSTDGDLDRDGDIDIPHSYGARSFSIYTEDGKQIFDSGDDFEQITAKTLGQSFNSDNTESNSGDSRSDNKGPEPEGICLGIINGHTYAFITLERISGIMIYDVSNPEKPIFQSYYNNRNFTDNLDYTKAEDLSKAGFLGPEGIYFINAKDSPTGNPLLLVANEVSGNVEILNIIQNLNP